MKESSPGTCGFDESWGLLGSDKENWKDVWHVDAWSKAQFVQRLGLHADAPLLTMSRQDESRRIWPVAIDALKIPNMGSSDAVTAVT